MKIHNDFRSLDQEIKVVQQEIEELSKMRVQLKEQIDVLQKKGFNDAKFIELKTAVEKSGNTMNEFNKSMHKIVDELNKRSKIIKEYYAVKL
jgi:seryl-tRNA synthetase